MELTKEQLDFYAEFIEKNLGIIYKSDNHYQLQRRLQQVAIQLGFDDVVAMHEALQNGIFGHAKTLILDIATNNETLFFRDKKIFDGFQKHILSSADYLDGTKPVTIWCAACSTGQEPYSLAMILDEFTKADPRRSYRIFATDFSDRVLDVARKGEYTQLEVQRGLKTKQLIKYFEKTADASKDTWQIKPSLQKQIEFDQLNLLAPWPHVESFDFIFCRNVLIYFEVDVKKKIIEKLYSKLNPGGYLVLGAAESLVGLSDSYVPVKLGEANYYQKADSVQKTA